MPSETTEPSGCTYTRRAVLSFNDLAEPIHTLWLSPLLDARDTVAYAPWVAQQADAFILRWLDDPALDLSQLMPRVKAAARDRILHVHREFAANGDPIPTALWPLGPTGAARALLRSHIQATLAAASP
jgi:hypothetical protein